MKSTRSGQKWAHVSCALWIPEVSIGSVDRMEPITKISSIPASRWALLCVLCRERLGACIQCSVKTCKTAYHVTCAFQHGLEMRAIIEDENAEDGVKLRSYCQKHSVKKEPKNSANAEKSNSNVSGSEDEVKSTVNSVVASSISNKKKVRKEMTAEERNHARMARLMEIQSEFDKHVSVKDISCHVVDVDQDGINHIYIYWILKRKSGGNHPLLMPKAGDHDVISQDDQEQAEIEKMKMFVHLRQDLERVRNLCYMVTRREKLSRSYFRQREQIFHKQMAVLSSCKKSSKQDELLIKATMEANQGPSMYDVLYSSKSGGESRLKLDEMIDAILGNSAKVSKDVNGSIKKEKKTDAISRYTEKFNGGAIKKSNHIYDTFSDDSDHLNRRTSRRKSQSSTRYSTHSASSTEDESTTIVARRKPSPIPAKLQSPQSSATAQPKKKGRPPGSTKKAAEEKRRLLNAMKKTTSTEKVPSLVSSSEDDDEINRKQSKSRLADYLHLSDESDELVPIKNSSGLSIPTTGNVKRIQPSAIYSDSDSSTDKDNKTDHTVSDSQQQPFRTKAAMKEFNINELLSLTPANKQKSNSNKKSSPTSATAVTKKQPPPRRESKASPQKGRKSAAKAPSLSSDSDEDEKNNKKDILSDFIVVPQREAAKKAQENLKTNPTTPVTVEKTKKVDKIDEVVPPPKSTTTSIEKESKKTSNSKKSSKEDETPSTTFKKPLKEEKKDAEIPLDFPSYVPQRQAAKKAAEHIKGLGTSAPPVNVVETKVTPASSPATPSTSSSSTKKPVERRKSVAIDLSSSSTSSSSSGSSSGSSSDSESDKDKKIKAPPTRRPSMSAAGLKQKTKESPFLDKSAKSSVGVRSSSSSSSSDSDSSTSDRPHTSRLSKKGSSSKRKSTAAISTVDSKSTEKKSSTSGSSSPSKKSSAVAKKETIKSIPTQATVTPSRRQSTAVKQQTVASPGSSKATNASRSPQKLSAEQASDVEPSTIQSRKRSTSTATATSSGKLSNNNRSRASDISKGDPIKLPDENVKSPIPISKEVGKRRKSTVVPPSPVKEIVKESPQKTRHSSRSDSIGKSPKDIESLKSPEHKRKDSTKSIIAEKVEKSRKETPIVAKATLVLDDAEVKMDIEESLTVAPISTKNVPPQASQMSSIPPPMNLNPPEDVFNSSTSIFSSIPRIADNKEDTERETYNLLEKLRQKNKKNNAPVVADNNNIEKIVPESQKNSPSLHRNENKNTPKHDVIGQSPQQSQKFSPSVLSNKDREFNELKKSTSPWHQNQIQPIVENNFQQRSILTSNNNKINAPSIEQSSTTTAGSLIEQQQKLVHPKLNEENNKQITNRANHQSTQPFGILNEQPNNSDIFMQQQQQTMKLSKEQKAFNAKLQQQQQQMINKCNENTMNVMNDMTKNHPAIFPHKNDVHLPPQMQGMFPYNLNENATQNAFPGAVSLFPPAETNQVQIPFPSPGQALFAPTFTGAQQQMQNAEPFGAQNYIKTPKIPVVDEKLESHKKSPSKSTRCSPRNSTPTHGGKTPQKSPGKSPRQPALVEPITISRQNSQKGKSTPNTNEPKQRKSRANSQASPADNHTKGRGRKNNNKSKFPQLPFIPSIDKKLVGTVYDFSADDEFNDETPSVEILRGLRDRKTSDMFNKINRDGSSQSPKVGTLKITLPSANNHQTEPIASIESPVIAPGPVDMRTLNSFDNTNDSSQLSSAFTSNIVDPTLNEIDDEKLKEINDKQKIETSIEITDIKSSNEVTNIVEESVDSEASFTKISLSDSRNQLKVKIKGPLAQPDVHYNAINNPVIPQNIATGASGGGSSNANSMRMRKKELLQQYWNQDMNVKQPHQQPFEQASMNVSRFSGIPKAVDSMGIEFDGFNYAEYKKRKRFAFNDGDLMSVNNCESNNSNNDNDSMEYNKKRRRANNRGGQQTFGSAGSNPPPKLKIKFGSDILETGGSDLPPKKRHTQAPPTYQDFKRDSMSFRKKMMDEFCEEKTKQGRTKEEKREKKEKKKKKKEKKSKELVDAQVPMKLILKIGNQSVATISKPALENSNSNSTTSSDTNKSLTMAPLKLKISRNSQGNGEYNVMNTDKSMSEVNNLQPPLIDDTVMNSIITNKIDNPASDKTIEASEPAPALEKAQTIPSAKNCEVR